MSDVRSMNSEQVTVNKGKKAEGKGESGLQLTDIPRSKNITSCLDCLHCKVSAKSTKNCVLCFCAETKKKENHKIPYWSARKICVKFEDMTV